MKGDKLGEGVPAKLEPDLDHAQETALVAHGVVIKLQEMGLPRSFDGELSSLSTDIGDLWGAQKTLAGLVDGLLQAPQEWETVGDYLVDLRAAVDHIDWHLKSIKRPMNKIARHAYAQVGGARK